MQSSGTKRKIARISSIVLFVIAGLLFIFCIWSFIYFWNALMTNIRTNGLTYKDNAYYIFETFLMAYPVRYLLHTVTMAALAMLLAGWHRQDKAGEDIPAKADIHAGEWNPFEITGDEDEVGGAEGGDDGDDSENE